jgi:hypothetical protein
MTESKYTNEKYPLSDFTGKMNKPALPQKSILSVY